MRNCCSWDRSKPSCYSNLVLLTEDEANKHDEATAATGADPCPDLMPSNNNGLPGALPAQLDRKCYEKVIQRSKAPICVGDGHQTLLFIRLSSVECHISTCGSILVPRNTPARNSSQQHVQHSEPMDAVQSSVRVKAADPENTMSDARVLVQASKRARSSPCKQDLVNSIGFGIGGLIGETPMIELRYLKVLLDT